MGFAEVDVDEAAADIRQRDSERLSEQIQGDAMSGRGRLLTRLIRRRSCKAEPATCSSPTL
ncbi:hypothetical protein NKI54_33060 [Mesorhizobium sp. M0663]|uniref:hypothetical protein n=1 Tax=unclassified Mesorhizobium TaxID=325217 RepID=UPI003337C4A2